MKVKLDVDKERILTLAKELENTEGINDVSFKYSTKSGMLKR